MPSKKQSCNSLSHIISGVATAALAIVIVLVLTVALAQSAKAQTFKVIYSFTGGADGGIPNAGLTIDTAGNLYGTTAWGALGYGTVFELKHSSSAWSLATLHTFAGGGHPWSRVVFGPDGSLYGTSYSGGTVFKLQPPMTACKTALCPWTETVLYAFTGGSDGFAPQGDLLFDRSGNIYGTAMMEAPHGVFTAAVSSIS